MSGDMSIQTREGRVAQAIDVPATPEPEPTTHYDKHHTMMSVIPMRGVHPCP